jgi:hypothetical protein
MRSDFSRSSKKPKNFDLDEFETASSVLIADNDFCPAFGRPDCVTASRPKGEDSIEIRSKTKRVMRHLPVHKSGAAPEST